MQTDEAGSYNEYEIPKDLELPIGVDERNYALADSRGFIQAVAPMGRDNATRIFINRKLKFISMLINGDITIKDGRVFKRKKGEDDYDKNGNLILSYEPIEVWIKDSEELVELVEEQPKSFVEKVVETVKRGRGRPRKVVENA